MSGQGLYYFYSLYTKTKKYLTIPIFILQCAIHNLFAAEFRKEKIQKVLLIIITKAYFCAVEQPVRYNVYLLIPIFRIKLSFSNPKPFKIIVQFAYNDQKPIVDPANKGFIFIIKKESTSPEHLQYPYHRSFLVRLPLDKLL